MSSSFILRVAALGLLFAFGCGDDGRPSGTAGNDSTLVGAPCIDNSECDKGLCQSGAAFPGSVCTLSCGGSNNCPSGSSCAALETGWICLVNCSDTSDCREQWSCQELTEAGAGDSSTVSVCIGPVPAS